VRRKGLNTVLRLEVLKGNPEENVMRALDE
jgi:hypothetical protein